MLSLRPPSDPAPLLRYPVAMDDITSFSRKTSKKGIDVSVCEVTPAKEEATIFSARPDAGSHPSASKAKSQRAARGSFAQKPYGTAKDDGRWRPAGKINLDAMEDRAWLGALVVGEGSIFNKGTSRQPCLSIKMCDKSAIDKASRLMGIGTIATGKTAIAGRQTWSVRATCSRALRVIAMVRPFLTWVKIRQARAAITRARSAGFKTREEMREERKTKVLETVRKMPGAYAKRIGRINGLNGYRCLKYLKELERLGRVRKESHGLSERHRLRWYPAQVPEMQESESLARNVERQEPRHQMTLKARNAMSFRKSFQNVRGGEPRLGPIESRAWLAALIVGEGTFYAEKVGRRVRRPRLVIKMQDKEAIDRAGALIGVRTCAAGFSTTGRRFWSVQAVGGRAIEIIGLVRPFMTPAKIRQAHRGIVSARRTGFRTLGERRDDRKRIILEYVRLNPGCLTRELASKTGISNRYRTLLPELEREGKLTKKRAARRRGTQWFLARS